MLAWFQIHGVNEASEREFMFECWTEMDEEWIAFQNAALKEKVNHVPGRNDEDAPAGD